jgi:hypothetical protein
VAISGIEKYGIAVRIAGAKEERLCVREKGPIHCRSIGISRVGNTIHKVR